MADDERAPRCEGDFLAPVREGARAPGDQFRGSRGGAPRDNGGPRDTRDGGAPREVRDGGAPRERWECTICKAMGEAERSKSHKTDFCFLNPRASCFRPNLWKFRVMSLLRAG